MINLDRSKTLVPQITSIKIPVTIAFSDSEKNMWRLSICVQAAGATQCVSETDASVLTTFVYAGFDIDYSESTNMKSLGASMKLSTILLMYIAMLSLMD